MSTTRTKLDTFTRAYIECALWAEAANINACEECGHKTTAEVSDCPECSGHTFGDDLSFQHRDYDMSDIAPASLERMIADCARFQEENAETLEAAECSRSGEYTDTERAGHDFWLTRNGHGAGFWDGDWNEPAATALTEAAKEFGECALYIGDDGKIYVS